MFGLGILAMAALILVSISLHEAGHMGTAKAFGMKVTRYFVGFGPTLFSWRRGETEYGVKGIPLGGFVKIVGMTPQDEDADDRKAMWRFPVWKRTIVMSAGSVVHFILAFLIFWGIAATAQMPGPNFPETRDDFMAQPALVTVAECVPLKAGVSTCADADPAGVAKAAGLQTDDKITQVGTMPVANYGDLVEAIRPLTPGEPVTLTYERDGVTATTTLTPVAVERASLDDPEGPPVKVAAIGIGQAFDRNLWVEYNAVEALPVAVDMAGTTMERVVIAVKKFPEKIPKLWTAIVGGERDPETPISVVGASRLGGELAEMNEFPTFFFLLAALNLFIGLFNLLPLLPLDGGHIAIAWFERARSWVYARMSRPDPGRVDYYKLMPVTYAVIVIFGAFTLLTVTADIVNPISILR